MSLFSRAARNVLRSRVRTIGVALALGIALSAFLILSQINYGVSENVASARAAVADLVTVQSANSSGFDASSRLPNDLLPKIAEVPFIVSVQRVLLETPGFTPGQGGGPGSGGMPANFTLYEGIDSTSAVSSFGGFGGGSGLTITAGSTLTSTDENRSVAIVGSTYASDHDVIPGSEISVNGSGMQVVGVFSSGSGFGGDSVILPYPAAAAAFAASGPNFITVTVSASADLDSVVSQLRTVLGSGVSVTAASQNSGGAFGSAVDSILSSTQFESYAALGIGAAVMVVVMALLTAQRTREIGLLKAIGFGNGKILGQLLTEGLLLSAIGLPVALVATVALGPTVAQYVATSSSSSGAGPGGRHFFGNFASRLVGGVSFALTPEILLLGAAVTIVFGFVGSAYPIARALRLRPAEAVRHE